MLMIFFRTSSIIRCDHYQWHFRDWNENRPIEGLLQKLWGHVKCLRMQLFASKQMQSFLFAVMTERFCKKINIYERPSVPYLIMFLG